MAINSSLLWNPCTILLKRGIVAYQNWTFVICFIPSLLMCVLCLSSRGVSMSHSMSWSWVTRSSRRSILVEFLSVIIVLGEELESKYVKINMIRWINIVEKGSMIMKIVIDSVPSVFLPYTWFSGRDCCLVGVSCHSPRILPVSSCICIHASC
jgi:hypothetical protein